MKKTLLFLAAVLMSLSMMAQANTYTMINSEASLSAGDKVILVGFNDDGTAYVMSYQKTNNRHAVEIDVAGGSITTEVATSASSQTEPYEFTVGGSTGAWTFFDALNNGYLYASGGGNYLKTQATLDNAGEWTLSLDGDGFIPTSNATDVEQNIMRYNSTSVLFGCYKPSSTIVGLVYIFKEGGEPTILPEPTNYPTNVSTTCELLDITVEWTDATGEQLPSKYLVVASIDGVTVPIDGVPVPNSELARNVNYGVGTVTFENLPAGTSFTFAIFPYTNSGEYIDYKTDGDYPSVTGTTDDVTCLFSSDFSNGLDQFTVFDLLGEQTWIKKTYNGVDYADMNGYAGGAHANEDWLITPDLFANGTYDGITIMFKNAYKYDGEPLRVYMLNGFDGASDPMDFVIQEITSSFEWSDGSYNWVTTSHSFNTTGIQNLLLAFKYTSTDEAASDWEITDIKVFEGYYAAGENNAVSFKLYPNPANSSINIEAENAAEVQIMDMAGRTAGSA